MSSHFQRPRYTDQGHRQNHVILSGQANYTVIIDFCREYFPTDLGGRIVITSSTPFYRSRVYYLSGTPLSLPDLRRAGVSSATGMFLLNIDECAKNADGGEDEQLRVTRGADAEIVMQALVSKTNFPDLAIFAEVQDIRSQDLARHCGTNPTLLYRREYKRGSENQIYAFKLPFGLIFVLWIRGNAIWFDSCAPSGATQFAIDEKICFNPGKDYLMADGQESDIRRIIYDFRKNPDPVDIPRSLYGILKRARSISAELQLLRAGTVAKVESETTNPFDLVQYQNTGGGTSEGFIMSGIVNEVVYPIVNHILICGNVTARAKRHFVRSRAETMSEEENGIWPDTFQYPKAYVVRGTPLKRTSLVKAGIDSASRVINFRSGGGGSTESGVNLDVTQALGDANSIFIVKMIQEYLVSHWFSGVETCAIHDLDPAETNNILKNLIEFAFSSPQENAQEAKTVEKRRAIEKVAIQGTSFGAM
ncbi:hypothetical protein BJ742DRAFT_876695 [Cladochytrium replicatum]|nr:hypothetical protein BJ742DRAFT_876695 [Cladochytrium replicatum]